MVTKTIPATTLKDFIGFAKANPTVLNFSSAGNGTIMHLTGEAFKVEAGVQMVHIPYKGSGLSIPDLISGNTPNHALNAGRAWLSNIPKPFTVGLPRKRAVSNKGVSSGI
ncbi:MAG: hypothetical protein EB123_07530 [Synechococcaceae bacterium WBB_32_011]|nr:hypothetical protein [Synechococcaceae bacterium WBB_32_011]